MTMSIMFRFQQHVLTKTLMACRNVENIFYGNFLCRHKWCNVLSYQTQHLCKRPNGLKPGCFVCVPSQVISNIHIMCSQFSMNIGKLFSSREDNSHFDHKNTEFVEQLSGSNALYKFKQALELDSRLKMSPDEWKTLESDILKENPHLHYSWAATCMMLIYYTSNVELGEDFLNYIRQVQGKSPNIPTLSTFIALCGRDGGRQKQDVVFREFNELQKQSELFDGITTKNLIVGFCGTDKWKKSLEFLEMTKLSQNPGPAYFNPIVIAALEDGDIDLVFSLLDTMGNQNIMPSNAVFEKFIDKCADSGSEGNISIRPLLEFFRKFNWIPDLQLAHQIEALFIDSKTENWKCHWTTVNKSGVCQSCKHRLERVTLTDADFQNLQQEFLTSALIGDNVYLKSNPKEVERFKDFIQEFAPFDVVLDALNVAALGHSQMLRKMVEFFAWHHHKKVLLIGRKHMQKSLGMNLQPIMNIASTFFTDNISKDDPFTLYAAIYSGKSTMLVSNDYMRDHKSLLRPSLQNIFEQWQRSRQISMQRKHKNKIYIQMPLKYNTGPQEDLKGWHVPYEDCSERAVYEHPNTYLCLRSKKLTKRTQKITKEIANQIT